MVLISKYIVPKGYVGITIFPFVFLKYAWLKTDPVLVNHERIHLRQQLELLVIPFYVWYGLEFLIKLLVYRKWHQAYHSVSFEKEAYANERNLEYLKSRRFFGFSDYV